MAIKPKSEADQTHDPERPRGVRMLWGHPMPTWSDIVGLEPSTGFWNEARYTSYLHWISEVRVSIRKMLTVQLPEHREVIALLEEMSKERTPVNIAEWVAFRPQLAMTMVNKGLLPPPILEIKRLADEWAEKQTKSKGAKA
jgi:hypothetical protein